MLKYSTYRSIYETPVQDVKKSDQPLVEVIKEFLSERKGKLLMILMVFLLFWTSAFSVFASGIDKPKGEKNVIVQPGESLWSIASYHKPQGMDTREYVNSIAEVNGLNGPDIQAGDVLSLPVW